MITLTKEQSQAIHQNGSGLAQVLDPQTQEAYVLIKAALFEQLQKALRQDEVRTFEALLGELAPEDWEDPANYAR